jgi:hypothetical protein
MLLQNIPIAELARYAGILTTQQAELLRGNTVLPDSYFNPIQDAQDRWTLSAEEIAYCSNPSFLWVKMLEMVPYEPKPSPPRLDMAGMEMQP